MGLGPSSYSFVQQRLGCSTFVCARQKNAATLFHTHLTLRKKSDTSWQRLIIIPGVVDTPRMGISGPKFLSIISAAFLFFSFPFFFKKKGVRLGYIGMHICHRSCPNFHLLLHFHLQFPLQFPLRFAPPPSSKNLFSRSLLALVLPSQTKNSFPILIPNQHPSPCSS